MGEPLLAVGTLVWFLTCNIRNVDINSNCYLLSLCNEMNTTLNNRSDTDMMLQFFTSHNAAVTNNVSSDNLSPKVTECKTWTHRCGYEDAPSGDVCT